MNGAVRLHGRLLFFGPCRVVVWAGRTHRISSFERIVGPYLGLSGYSFMMAAWACLKGVLTSFILAPERPSDRRFLRGSLHFPEGPETPGFGRFLAEGLHLGLQLGVTFPTERGYKVSVSAWTWLIHKESRVRCPAILLSSGPEGDSDMLRVGLH